MGAVEPPALPVIVLNIESAVGPPPQDARIVAAITAASRSAKTFFILTTLSI